ncbi:MAG: RIP metalloprotease RseP [Aphanocapsa feldmannii 288cV]|nr:MAG: RIP metalloprotease RseP [Aphanocapsa feldmannii 288cV]
MGVLAALAVLAALIVVHEGGHFFAATWQGIRVSSFSIGFGPVLLQRQRRGVQFALRAIPMGGFVAFPDDDPEGDIAPDDPDLLSNRPAHQRALVIAAGVLANLLFAWLVLFSQTLIYGIPDGINTGAGVMITHISAGQRAASAGLRSGERVLAINGVPLGQGEEAVHRFVAAVQQGAGETLLLRLEGAEGERSLELVPAEANGVGRIGAQLQPFGSRRYRRSSNAGAWIAQANSGFWQITSQTLAGYGALLTSFAETAPQVGGPVKIVELGANLARQGSDSLFLFTALISINLAVLNALPLPALDGGQMLLLLLEALRGKPLPEAFTEGVTRTGFALLLGLIAVLVVKDTSQLSVVRQLLGN